MAVNKVIYGNTTLIDLSSDTVTADDVLPTVSFHSSSGVITTGTADGRVIYVDNSAGTPVSIKNALDAKASAVDFTATLSTSWTGSSAPYTQTLSIPGMLSTDNPFVDVDTSGATAATIGDLLAAWSCVHNISTGTNTITATCYGNKPTVAIPLRIKVVR